MYNIKMIRHTHSHTHTRTRVPDLITYILGWLLHFYILLFWWLSHELDIIWCMRCVVLAGSLCALGLAGVRNEPDDRQREPEIINKKVPSSGTDTATRFLVRWCWIGAYCRGTVSVTDTDGRCWPSQVQPADALRRRPFPTKQRPDVPMMMLKEVCHWGERGMLCFGS